VTGVRAGRYNPIILKILAIVFSAMGIILIIAKELIMGAFYMYMAMQMAILPILLGGILFILYYKLRSMMFGFYNGGDRLAGAIYVKGRGINTNNFEQASELLNKVVHESRSHNTVP